MTMEQLKHKKLVLATDLDGTFLGGDGDERASLYDFVAANRDWLGLVFVTGRDLDFISDITAKDVPVPDLIIGDVGTTVVCGRTHTPLETVNQWISACWGGPEAAQRHVANVPALREQTGFGGRRLSYYYDDEQAARTVAAALDADGYDVLMSDGIYFDILPRGVQKGPTLLKVIDLLALDADAVFVAGDTLNDRSLFETGLDGVVVGNAEAGLVQAVCHLSNVYCADGNGAAGVFEGLQHKLSQSKFKEAI